MPLTAKGKRNIRAARPGMRGGYPHRMSGGASWSSPISPIVQRGQLLLQQGRAAMAEEQFRLALSQDAQAALPHVMLAYALAAQRKYEDATFEAQQAIGLEPDNPQHHQALGWILLRRNRIDEADIAAKQAVALDPHLADAWSLCAAIAADRKDWREALDLADRALQQDAEHEEARNLRAAALRNLGRHEEARATLGGALERNPDSSFTHANAGWTALHAGGRKNVEMALEHFREALRLEADNQWAKAGMVEALKARHLVYRLMLKWFLWMASLKPGVQWGILIGAFLGAQIIRGVANSVPAAGVVLWPLYGCYVLFAITTWLSYPLSNLLLRLNKFGRYALSEEQRKGSTLVGLCIGSALLFVVVTAVVALSAPLSPLAIAMIRLVVPICLGLLLLTLPTSMIYNAQGSARTILACVTAGLLVLFLIDIGTRIVPVSGGSPALARIGDFATMAFFLGIIGSQFLAMHLAQRRPRL